MATRKIKDAKDLSTNELIYFKGHAQATYMSDGRTVEEAISSSVKGDSETMVCAYTIGSYTANHIELENYTYNGQTMDYREGAIISVLNPYSTDIVFVGGTVTLDGNEYEAGAFTLKSGATALFSLGPDAGIMIPVSSVVESNSGGSSDGGSSAYSEVNHGTSDRTFTLTPNTFHVWDEMTAMTLTLGAETSGVANEYLFQFKSPATPTSLFMPDDIKFSEDLIIEANKIYQISILKGLGSVLSWDNAPALIENKVTVTVSGNTATATLQYAAASSLSIKVIHDDGSNTITIPVGEVSGSVNIMSPMISNLRISTITPEFDTNYIYVK